MPLPAPPTTMITIYGCSTRASSICCMRISPDRSSRGTDGCSDRRPSGSRRQNTPRLSRKKMSKRSGRNDVFDSRTDTFHWPGGSADARPRAWRSRRCSQGVGSDRTISPESNCIGSGMSLCSQVTTTKTSYMTDRCVDQIDLGMNEYVKPLTLNPFPVLRGHAGM